MDFDLVAFPAVYDMPQWLTPHTAWSEHIPFAFFIMQIHNPGVFVELGTHAGDSYCAFCQAVQKGGSATKCSAVDTWKGDVHSGAYNEGIYTQLKTYHDARYGAFSRLMRMDFDSAAREFADGSIDLLHIDGLHTYEAVKHDFETWLPKMSKRGLVLFHDTAVKEGDFGVHKLFAEVSAGRRAFEFLHCHGLGLLAVGNDLPRETAEFLDAAIAHPQRYRDFFAAVGAGHGEARIRSAIVAQLQGVHDALTAWRRQNGLPVPQGAGTPNYVHANPSQGIKSLWDQLQATVNEYEQMKRQLPAAPGLKV